MWTVIYFLLCSFVVVLAEDEVNFDADMPLLKVKHNDQATLECCYSTNVVSLKSTWMRIVTKDQGPRIVNESDIVIKGNKTNNSGKFCGTLYFKSAQLTDTALYLCQLTNTRYKLNTHGTYLQVHKPLEKMIELDENTKNKILTAEGILLFLCVLLPATTILCQNTGAAGLPLSRLSKKLNELERKKMKKEEENIYQGLNLDDCCTTYDQIERSQAHGPYQDVCNIMEEDEIQLEKP